MNIEIGKWYIAHKDTVAKVRPRWILAVNDRGVIYGTGGIKHRECKLKTFLRWAKKFKAKAK